MKKTSDISKEDSMLFRDTVGNITPLKQSNVVHNKSKPSSTSIRSHEEEHPVVPALFDSEYEENSLERGDEMFFSRPGLQKQTIRKLRRGQFNIEDELDLHGLTVDMARNELTNFLADCQEHSLRCIRIIHGKGIGSENKKPIIKNKVNNWLRQRADVLAFCSTQPADGGTGAVYCLLKRN
jgi:DNA-nicking Smr family endonuclease